MHGLRTIYHMNLRNEEAERIMAKHAEADKAQKELFSVDQAPSEERPATSEPQ